MKKRNSVLDIMKGIGIILVVLGHSIFGNIGGSGTSTNQLYNAIYSCHMALFFLVAGFLLYSTMPKGNYEEWLIKKFKFYVIPHIWVDVAAYALPFIAVFLLIPKPLITLPNYITATIFTDYGEWFLMTMFGVIAILSLIFSSGKYMWLSFICLLVLIFVYPAHYDYIGVNEIQWYILFAITGYLIARYFNQLKKYWFAIIIGALSFIPMMVYTHWQGGWYKIQPLGLLQCLTLGNTWLYVTRLLQALTGIALITVISILISKTKIAPMFQWLGRYSLAIYITHSFFIYLGFGSGTFRIVTTFLICMAISTTIILLMRNVKVVQRWFPKKESQIITKTT